MYEREPPFQQEKKDFTLKKFNTNERFVYNSSSELQAG